MSLDLGLVIASLRNVLEACRNAAVAAGVELPERQYVTTGGAVYDCAQVSVSANTITTGIAGQEGAVSSLGACPPGWMCALEVAIVRSAQELPQGRRGTQAPSVADIEIDTAAADADAMVLTSAVEAIAGPGWDQYGQVPASVQFGEVSGGYFAVVLTVTLNLWDIPANPPGV